MMGGQGGSLVQEVDIRGFAVGLVALAALAAAGLLLTKRRPALQVSPGGESTGYVDDLYAAGL